MLVIFVPESIVAKTSLSSGGKYYEGSVLRILFLSPSISSTRAPNMNIFSGPTSSAISTLAPSIVPMMRDPLSTNFMFEVPLASRPAVEIC